MQAHTIHFVDADPRRLEIWTDSRLSHNETMELRSDWAAKHAANPFLHDDQHIWAILLDSESKLQRLSSRITSVDKYKGPGLMAILVITTESGAMHICEPTSTEL